MRLTVCLKVPFRLAARTFQLGRRISSSQKGCGTSVTSSKPVAIGSTSGLESTEAAASIAEAAVHEAVKCASEAQLANDERKGEADEMVVPQLSYGFAVYTAAKA